MRVALPTTIACLFVFASSAAAQPPRNVRLVLAGGVWAGLDLQARVATDTIDIGKTTTVVFSMRECESVIASGGAAVDPNATLAWRIAITPTKTAGTAVTMRVTAARLVARGWVSEKPLPQESEVTLEPGEQHTIDYVKPATGTTVHPSCGGQGVFPGVSVSSELGPGDDFMERRLVATEMWLVERRPDGTQALQQFSLRGVPDREGAFYFDRIKGAERAFIDLSGTITPRLNAGSLQIDVKVLTRTIRETETGGFSGLWAKNFWATADAGRDEVVEVALPALEAKDGPFAGRAFAVRIRAKQVR